LEFDPKDFYVFSCWVVEQNSNDEAGLRAAISRSYYAAHLIAREKLRQKGWSMATGFGSDHSAVIRELRTRRFRTHGDTLALLKECREHADYHLDSTESELNRDCKICQKLRTAGASKIVEIDHWQEAQNLVLRCLPLLEKI
jgi:hypothetical protein